MNTVQSQIDKALMDVKTILADAQDQNDDLEAVPVTFPAQASGIYLISASRTYERFDEVFHDRARRLDVKLVPQASRGSRAD